MDNVSLSFDERNVATRTCPRCGGDYEFVTAFLLRTGDAYAVYYASIGDGHEGERRVEVDVLIGGWGDDSRERLTFSCDLRPAGAMAVDAPAALDKQAVKDDGPSWLGQPLTRDEALRHPGIDEFWAIIDWISVHDEAVARQLAG